MNQTFTTNTPSPMTMAEVQAAVEKIRGIPPSKWLLISPTGATWAEEDPTVLAAIARDNAWMRVQESYADRQDPSLPQQG